MINNNWSIYGIGAARTLASLIAALLLAFGGDVFGRVLNLTLGFPWSQQVHLNIHLVAIGLGAGIGAYLGWINFRLNRYWGSAILALVLTASVVGIYLGRALGPGVDPTYWWSRFAVDTTIHLAAAVGGTIVATVIGLTQKIILDRQSNSRPHISSMTTAGTRSTNIQ
jgi:hypothetical protein